MRVAVFPLWTMLGWALSGAAPAGASSLEFSNPMGHAQALRCMTEAIYYEAALEPQTGQEAVAQVILNRLQHSRYPKTVCGVVYQGSARRTGCQFTFTCDGSLRRQPLPALWMQAQAVAARALEGRLWPGGASSATHYHAVYVRPAWSAGLTRLQQIGAHIFYTDGTPRSAAALAGPPRRAAAPSAAEFSGWGLTIAIVRPGEGGPVVSPAP